MMSFSSTQIKASVNQLAPVNGSATDIAFWPWDAKPTPAPSAPTPTTQEKPTILMVWGAINSDSAPGTNYANGKLPTDIVTLRSVLASSLTGEKAKKGLFNESVCYPMAGLLAHELYRKKIPYRAVDDGGKEMLGWDGLADKNLTHRSLRVFTKDQNGGNPKWMIVDPTIGQWFSGGTVDRTGKFIPEKEVLSGTASDAAIFVGTYQELVTAFEKNIDHLSDRQKYIVSCIEEKLMNGKSNKKLSSREKAIKLVELYYGKPNTVGIYAFNPSWKPQDPKTYKKLYDEVTNFQNSQIRR